MGAREELRQLNLAGHAPRLGSSMAGVTAGWGLEWNPTGGPDADGAFDPVALGGGSGAPVGAAYVVLALDGTLTADRRARVGAGLTLVDGGANADVTLGLWFASEAQGDLAYRGASAWTRLAAGTSSQVLASGGPSANPSWVTPAPTGAQYVVLAADATLTDERVDTAGDMLEHTDAGAGAALTRDVRATCPNSLRRRVEWYATDAGASAGVGMLGAWGSVAFTRSSEATERDAMGLWARATQTGAGSKCGWVWNVSWTQPQYCGRLRLTFQVGAANANTTYWAGWVAGNPAIGSVPTANHAALRYQVGTDTTFQLSVGDGVAETTADTGVTVATDTAYEAELEWRSTPAVRARVRSRSGPLRADGSGYGAWSAWATVSAGLPASTANLGVWFCGGNVSGTGPSIMRFQGGDGESV